MSASDPCACADCGAATAPCTGRRGCRHVGKWEYYMVHESVWKAAGLKLGYLCIACLEMRLGRELTALDFNASLSINAPHPWDTPRLAARKQFT